MSGPFLKCHCNGKIVDLILIATEQHFLTRLNSAFSFLISCLVSEIFGFLKHANYVSLDVIYSRIINYIYKTMNISECSWQNLFELCTSIVMKKVHTTVHTVLLPWRSFGCKCPLFKKQKTFISLQLKDIYCNAHKGTVICTSRSHFLHLNHHTAV